MFRNRLHLYFMICLSIAILSGFSMIAHAATDSSTEFIAPTVTTYSFGYKSLLKDTVQLDSNTVYNRITLFGIVNPNSDENIKYGILLTKANAEYESVADTQMVVGASSVMKYPAQAPYILPYYIYGVSLCGSNLNEGMFYIRPYVEYTQGSETKYAYGRVVNTVLSNPQPTQDVPVVAAPAVNTSADSTLSDAPAATTTTETAPSAETVAAPQAETTTDASAPDTSQGGVE